MRFSRSMFSLLSIAVLFAAAVLFPACGGGGGGDSGPGVTYDNSRVNGPYTYVAMGNNSGAGVEVGTITFDGAGNGVYSTISTTMTVTGTVTYTVTTDNTMTLKDPVYGTSMVGTLRSGGSFFVGVDTTTGSETMITAVKRSKLVSDSTVTYYSGQFSYDNGSSARIVGIQTAAPIAGTLAWAEILPPGLTGTETYTFLSDGTLSIPGIAPNMFGAVTDDHQLMILGDGETVQSPEILSFCGFRLPGSGRTNASLNGTYLLYEFWDDNVAVGSFVTSRGLLSFNGSGFVQYSELASSTGTISPGGGYVYTVLPDGTFLINGTLPGVVIQDGSVLGIIDYDATDNEVAVMIAVKQ